MAVVTFYTEGNEQAGNTVSAVSYATYLGITKNKRTLLLSTSFNGDEIKNAFWENNESKKNKIFNQGTNNAMSDNGIEGLDRIIRSNRITPELITDYTKVVLRDRLEILMGYKGINGIYLEIQKQYPEILPLASKYYDNVIVDLSKDLEKDVQNDIIYSSDIVVAVTPQKVNAIQNILQLMQQNEKIKKKNTLLALGRYDMNSKYNSKNISRNLLKVKKEVNTIPYNTLIFEAMQEGKIIDEFLRFLNLKIRDENTFFLDEMKRLNEDIEERILYIEQTKG